VASGT